MSVCGEEVQGVFVDAFVSGLTYSEKLDEIDNFEIEKVFRKFGYDYKSKRAMLYCEIIEKKQDIIWSEYVLKMLKDIAENHQNPCIGEIEVKTDDDKDAHTVEMIEANLINSVRGVAAKAIGHILWNCKEFLSAFKHTIEILTNDENPIIRYSSLYALWPSYNIDRDWAKNEIVKVFLSDYRMLGFRDRSMLFLLHDEYSEQLSSVLLMGFYSDDKHLQQFHGYTISEMYMHYGEYSEVINDFYNLNNIQRSAIVHMFAIYLGVEQHKESAKCGLLKFLEHINYAEIENTWTHIFDEHRLVISEDKEFLMRIMTSGIEQKLLDSFIRYIEENGRLLEFSDIIFNMSYCILENISEMEDNIWEIKRDIPKLVLALYDETSAGKTKREKEISLQCLDIWDLLFEKQIGNTRILSKKMMEL